MGNIRKKAATRLKRRQTTFDNQRNQKGQRRPGSMNPHKSHPAGKIKR